MRRVIPILFIIFQTLPGDARAQSGEIFGTVVDLTGDALPGTEVTLSGATEARAATTAADGGYRFEGLAPGEYQLRAALNGFRESIRGVVVDAGGVLNVAIALQPAYAETVIVTASRDPRSLIAAPAAVAVLDAEQIEMSAADNFADLLRAVPGLNVMQVGARDINVTARSGTHLLANSMLVMVDGRSFFQPIFGAVYWDLMTVDQDQISQIEVQRTPGSAMWGANALNGVINLRTKSPREMQGLRGEIGFGEIGTSMVSASWADATDRLSYRISGSYFEQDAWERDNLLPDGSPMPPGVIFENRGTEQPKLDVRVDWDADPSRVWSLRGGLAGANGYIFGSLGPSEFGSRSYYSYLELDHQSEAFDLKLYWNRLDAPFRIVLFGLDEDSTQDTFVADVLRRQRVGDRHTFTFGGSARLDRFDITIAPADTGRLDVAGFVEDVVRVNDRLDLIVGGRVDKFETTDAVFAPRVSVVFRPRPAHAIRFAYNRAYRAPSLLENFLDVDLPTVIPLDPLPPFVYFQSTVGSTDLKMEELDAVEVGYTGVLNSRTTLSATVYRQTIDDNVRFFPVTFFGPANPPPGWPLDPAFVPPLPDTLTFLNIGTVRDQGIEIAVNSEWPRLSLQASYTYKDVPHVETGGFPFPFQLNRPSPHLAGAGVIYRADRWTGAVDLSYTDEAFWSDVFTEPFWGYTDDYVMLNARFGYQLPSSPIELWVSASNLLDEKIKSHVFSDIIRRKVTSGVSWSWE